MSGAYVIIDANKDHNWETIVGNVMYWKISVGSLKPELCDHVTVSDEDVELLLDRAMMLIADRGKYRNLAHDHKIPFVDVSWGTMEEIMERIDNAWKTGPADLNHSHI